jgi:hypothetical protein
MIRKNERIENQIFDDGITENAQYSGRVLKENPIIKIVGDLKQSIISDKEDGKLVIKMKDIDFVGRKKKNTWMGDEKASENNLILSPLHLRDHRIHPLR